MQYWFSFSSHPKGFLGVVIVEADSDDEALAEAVSIAPQAAEDACEIETVMVEGYPEKWLNRLITKPEVLEIGKSTKDTVQ